VKTVHCRKVKKELTKFLAEECRSSEAAALAEHVADCRSCATELEELRRLNRLLDFWEPDPAPDGLWESVMAEVSRINPDPGPQQRDGGAPVQKRFIPPRSNARLELIRDLAVAAAISLVLFWNAGVWLGEGKMLAAGKNVTGYVAAYSRVTDTAVERFTETTGEYTRKIFFEEWKQ
jgi:hypothetical protein